MNKLIGTAFVVAIIAGGSGFLVGSHSVSTSTNQQTSGQYGNGAFRGARGGASSFGGATMGTIVASDPSSITIQLANASSTQESPVGTKLILLSNTTQIEKTVLGTQSDLAAGASVMVTGTANSDGSITASSVQLRPSRGNLPSAPQAR